MSDRYVAGAARLNFHGVPDGPAPENFGPGPALLTTNPPDDRPTELRVIDGKLTNESTVDGRAAGYYTSASLGAPITVIGARWAFTPRGGTSGALALLVSQHRLRPGFPVHLVITPEVWTFGIWPPDRAAPDGLQTLQWQHFPVPLKQDGEHIYETQVELRGQRAIIDLPDGRQQIIRDRRIADWAGPFATFEISLEHGLTDSRVGFTEIWADSIRPR
ncbi:hypothetical protein A5710_08595 [Mycolicibacter sinensis]|uniref:Uncharacterized protein n=2 Tax=Mycolicibacter sinensis (strain JDM601) TaxID=875328 RepID=A0A1A2P1G8_MYCSD|nr:hypothetical protein A5694_13740 [Mycolicibacter sinensis]OBI25730.1 hypothetical protein A5710_08595 [Mycolicibacter sinensis]